MVSPLDTDVFSIGALVNNTYRIEKILGRGAMGEVYLARNDLNNKIVAIKALKSTHTNNEMHLELMKREEAVSAVNHPAVVRYIDLSRTERLDIYLVMEYVDGPSLESVMKRGPVGIHDLLQIGRAVAEGLAACHARHVIHRDLSPDNIILRDGRPDQPVIIDFGIAKDSGSTQTVIGGQFAGKYTYAPPEQFQGIADARSDLYALGVTLLAAYRGRAPSFGDNDFAIVQNKQLPMDLADVPDPLRGLLDDLTDPDPNRRPASAEALVAWIDALIDQIPEGGGGGAAEERTVIGGPAPRTVPPRTQAPRTQAPRTQAPPRTEPPRPAPPPPAPEPAAEPPRRRGGAGIAILVVLLLLGGGGVALWQTGMLGQLIPGLGGPAKIEPYRFAAAGIRNGGARLSGHVPDDKAGAAIAGYLGASYETAPENLALPLGAGAPSERFAEDMIAMMRPLEGLEDWELDVTDREVALTGLAPDKAMADAVRGVVGDVAQARGYTLARAEIAAGPRQLQPEALEPVLRGSGGCGALGVAPPPSGASFGLGEPVRVSGFIPAPQREAVVRSRLEAVVGDRPVDLALTVLNDPVCLVKNLLPGTGSAEMEIRLGLGGEAPRDNPAGTYAVGDNPLIDIVLPETASWGYLHVVAVDVSDSVFHLIPNNNRQETLVADLGSVVAGRRIIRVAHDLRERDQPGKSIAFTIDETFGKTLVIAFHTREPLFGELRPISESAGSFAEALARRLRDRPITENEVAMRLLDTRAQ